MAWMFFTTWLVFAKYVILNQFASIVCDTWSETKQAEKHPVGQQLLLVKMPQCTHNCCDTQECPLRYL